MKKSMAFVFGLVLSVSLLFCGKVGANPPLSESSKVVVNNLNRVVTNERLLEGADLDRLTKEADEHNGLYSGSFSKVIACYTDLLGECLAKHEPIPFNCRVFAAYAFSKFSEVGVNCQYLKIDDAERCAHAVVMMPQKEGERTKWYICDFLRAVETHNEFWLFVPLTEYMDLYHRQAAPLKCLTVCDVDSDRFFGTTDYCDLRVWLADVAKDCPAATSVINWEVRNNVLLALPSDKIDSRGAWPLRIASLCTAVDPARAFDWMRFGGM